MHGSISSTLIWRGWGSNSRPVLPVLPNTVVLVWLVAARIVTATPSSCSSSSYCCTTFLPSIPGALNLVFDYSENGLRRNMNWPWSDARPFNLKIVHMEEWCGFTSTHSTTVSLMWAVHMYRCWNRTLCAKPFTLQRRGSIE